MTSRVLTLVAETDVPPLRHNEIPMEPWMYGAIALAVFALMFAILWSFRNTAPKLGERGTAHGSDHAHQTNTQGSGH